MATFDFTNAKFCCSTLAGGLTMRRFNKQDSVGMFRTSFTEED